MSRLMLLLLGRWDTLSPISLPVRCGEKLEPYSRANQPAEPDTRRRRVLRQPTGAEISGYIGRPQ